MNPFNKMLCAAVAMALVLQDVHANDDTAFKAQQLLDQVKTATGGDAWDRLDTLHWQGTISGSARGTYDYLVDLRHVRSIRTQARGAWIETFGWNGRSAWATDGSGQGRTETAEDSIADAIGRSYRSAYAFYWPERWPASRDYIGERQVAGRVMDVIKVTPQGAAAFELWIDRARHRIVREVELTGAQRHTALLGDYREVDGVLLPFRIDETMRDPRFDTAYVTGTLDASGALARTRFAAPPPHAEPDPFPAGQDQVRLPFQQISNHIYVDVSINGQPSAPYIFDTGGVFIFDQAHARRLGIAPDGIIAGSGFGNGLEAMAISSAESVDIGGFRLRRQAFLNMDLSDGSRIDDHEIAGIVGYDVVMRAVTTIDYAHHLLTLTRPSRFRPPQDAVALPLSLSDRTPTIDATVDGIPGRFQIDTGSKSALTLMQPFVEANHLVERYRPTLAAQVAGAGGTASTLLTRTQELKLGPFSIKRPVTALLSHGAGVGSAGNIGGEILKRFTVTLDYGRQIMYLQPNVSFASPMVYDRSGLKLRRDADGGILIAKVERDSGAGEAGLKAGDRIVGVGSARIDRLGLEQLRAMLSGEPGTELAFSIVRDANAPFPVVFRLRELIPL